VRATCYSTCCHDWRERERERERAIERRGVDGRRSRGKFEMRCGSSRNADPAGALQDCSADDGLGYGIIPARSNEFTSGAAIARNTAALMLKYGPAAPLLRRARIMNVISLVGASSPREFRSGSCSRPTSLSHSSDVRCIPQGLAVDSVLRDRDCLEITED